MNNNSRSLFLITVLTTSFIISCSKKNDPALSLPVLTTTDATAITSLSATSGGNITSDGGSPVTAHGVCWGTGSTPSITDSKTDDGAGAGNFASSITGLKESTLYNVRAYATNSSGIAYGNIVSFTTPAVTDIDGNVYHSITIGTQVWMVENLKVTKYNDGTAISLVSSPVTWSSQVTGAYCFFDNDVLNKGTYGALYNWYAVETGKLCPPGWHVPTDSDWNKLISFVGVSGGRLKETGTVHWQAPNTGATNDTGFTALPGGIRTADGTYFFINQWAYWWSRSENNTGGATNNGVGYNFGDGFFGNSNNKKMGYSVRCVKDL
jgi:uncharacterized protein (TIGR02145 family)